MLATLRKFPLHGRKRVSQSRRTSAFTAIALAACLAPCSAIAQKSTSAIVGGGVGGNVLLPIITPNANTPVLTYHNDNQRTGVNPNEIAFTTANPSNPGLNFGKLWNRPVDGTIFAEPLFVPNVQMPNVADVLNRTTKNGVYNVVLVATSHNSVYAFDAGGSSRLSTPTLNNTSVRTLPLWHINFNSANAQVGPVSTDDVGTQDLSPEIGIVGTPVISASPDPKTGFYTGTLYVVVKTKEAGNFAQRIHAIDITTGLETARPVLINASVPGVGDGSLFDFSTFTSSVPFDPLWENQQAALTLGNGNLYVTWGSHGNNGPFHGWVLAYSVPGLKLVGAFNTTPDADSSFLAYPGGGGTWQGGAGPSLDAAGNLYFATGTGLFDASDQIASGRNFGQSVLKLNLANPATPGTVDPGTVADYFTPFNWEQLSDAGLDVGSGGVVVLPDVGNAANPNLAVIADTEGTIYLLDRDNMGQYTLGFNNIVQELDNAVGPVFGIPAYFNGSLFFQGTGDFLKAFGFQNGLLTDAPTSQSRTQLAFPGSSPIVTSKPDGSNGIVWTLERFATPSPLPGFGIPDPTPFSVVHAYDATNLNRELYSGLTAGGRDLSSSAVYTSLMVANGRAYVGGINELVALGNYADNGMSTPAAQADHFIVTGPSLVAQNTGNWYSVTAIGPDNNPINLTGTVHLSYRATGGGTFNVTSLAFNNQSNIVFNYAFQKPGAWNFYVNDDSGHSTFVPFIDMMPPGTLFNNIAVLAPDVNGPDHLVITAPATAKAGSTVPIKAQIVTSGLSPFTLHLNGANFFFSNIRTQVTIPSGTQGSIPGVPIYAYSNGPGVPFVINTSAATANVRVPSVGNNIVVVSGTFTFQWGTDPANPTLVVSYPVTGTAKIIGLP